MPNRQATAEWAGTLEEGIGSLTLESGTFEGNYTYDSRFGAGSGTNPEELIGAAHAGCFSMALALVLGKAGYDPERIETTAEVALEKRGGDFSITRITLDCTADVSDIDPDEFQRFATQAKEGCPVSKALSAVEIQLNATLSEG